MVNYLGSFTGCYRGISQPCARNLYSNRGSDTLWQRHLSLVPYYQRLHDTTKLVLVHFGLGFRDRGLTD